MKYLIIGAGGTGGMVSAYMSKAGKDVTLIARGYHLDEIRFHGMNVKTTWEGTYNVQINAVAEKDYLDRPDVIFVCVKSYNLEGIIPLIRRVAYEGTIVIPLLNGLGVTEKLQVQLPGIKVIDGLIYISANKEAPGNLKIHGNIFRVIFGTEDHKTDDPKLRQVEKDLIDSGIDAKYSDQIQKEILLKFSYISPWAACGVQFNVTAEHIQQEGYVRRFFIKLVQEVEAIGKALGVTFDEDLVTRNLAILDSVAPTAIPSLQRDLEAGKLSEIDSMIMEVIRLSEKTGVPVPNYRKVVETPIRNMMLH